MYSWQFKKKFPLPKNGGHFVFSNFLQKMEKHKFATISLTMQDRAISLKFSTHRVSLRNVLLAIFKIISSPQKWRPFLIFEFLPKMAKHKFASISLTVRDRAISSKFSTHRLSGKYTLTIFKKNFLSQKWRPFSIFEF